MTMRSVLHRVVPFVAVLGLVLLAATGDVGGQLRQRTVGTARPALQRLPLQIGTRPTLAGCVANDDDFEPNDAAASPALVAIPGIYENRRVCSQDADWYRVGLIRQANVSVRIIFQRILGDIGMTLYQPDGATPVAQSSGSGGNKLLEFTAPADQQSLVTEYLLRIHTTAREQTYTMYWKEDLLEPNDTAGAARRVQVGQDTERLWVGPNSDDWWSFELVAGQRFAYGVPNDRPDLTTPHKLYRSDGTTQVSTWRLNPNDAFGPQYVPSIPETGTYLLHVRGSSSYRIHFPLPDLHVTSCSGEWLGSNLGLRIKANLTNQGEDLSHFAPNVQQMRAEISGHGTKARTTSSEQTLNAGVTWIDSYVGVFEPNSFTSGTYTVTVRADPTNHVLESDEGNNVTTCQVTVP